MGDDEDDLSPYERLRLEKIQRNKARLKALGLDRPISVAAGRPAAKDTSAKQSQTKKRKRKSPAKREPVQGQRRSKRIRDKAVKIEEGESAAEDTSPYVPGDAQSSDVEEAVVDYTSFPQDPDELDDDEFQVYASLRRWRLIKSRELDVEAYKVCQNRTLCELIRRRRNCAHWGAEKDGSGGKKDQDMVANELLECWGIGPSKARPGKFGPEMAQVMDGDKEKGWLQTSRKRT